jgi:hypothetical protein
MGGKSSSCCSVEDGYKTKLFVIENTVIRLEKAGASLRLGISGGEAGGI